ncbi:hypothetical protein GALL_121140 [mine drainage metagenome]|uniref:Uncharacterized protein n=1 Tax=mine drainage metagenome TaxID=410659 RepID=A0A1J5SBE2_9ZZZZ
MEIGDGVVKQVLMKEEMGIGNHQGKDALTDKVIGNLMEKDIIG